ncbi:Mia40 protein [Saccharomycopsis crataegensis]|uniref:Mitochondrial intermembrane space import and assembly protein 40 n=1 Tax=Saccharomycopsis crataegensis TaxID=43959 RepID=A0AAV5QIW9_9ASCO|nr:Mia40 protein [Saccharomycopsis crataegensis]
MMQRTVFNSSARAVSRRSLVNKRLGLRSAAKRFNSSHQSKKSSSSFDPAALLFPLSIIGGLAFCYHDRLKITSYTHKSLSEFAHQAKKEADDSKAAEEPNPSSEEEKTEVSEESQTVNEDNSEEPQEQAAAYNPETGEINWDCPCLGGMANGPCGEEFKEAFSCFVYSEAEPKGIDCIEKFKHMQDCFRKYPEVYAEELREDEVPIAEESTPAPATEEPITTPAAAPATEEPITTPAAAPATEEPITTPAAAPAIEEPVATPATEEPVTEESSPIAAEEPENTSEETTPATDYQEDASVITAIAEE